MAALCTPPDLILAQLRRASFKGIPFYVDSTTENYGRRVVVHQFPLIDSPLLEDLGAEARKVNIEGYIAGPAWSLNRNALIAAVESGRLGVLRHPFYGRTIRCAPISISVTESKETLGYVKFSAEFIESTAGGPFGIISGLYFPYIIIGAVDAFIGSLLNVFNLALNVVGAVDYVISELVGALDAIAQLMDGSRLLTRLVVGSDLFLAIRNFHAAIPLIAAGKEVLDGHVYALVNAWRLAPLDPVEGAAAMARLYSIGIDDTIRTGARSRVVSDTNVLHANRLFRRIFGALYAEFMAQRSFDSSVEGYAAKAELVNWFSREEEYITTSLEADVYDGLGKVRAPAVEAVSIAAGSSQSVIGLTLPRPRSALSLATEVYGDPERAIEIWRRSGAPHPAWIGPQLDVRAR